MVTPKNVFRVSLGAVVLDRPDLGGLYIAKDLIGGWAYLIADGAGDHRFRGQGVCAGGLDMALRCAVLAALGRVPESRQIRVLVAREPEHRAMAELARTDARVIAAIAGRPVAIMTRPDERSAVQVRAAAERAASAALLDRERAELAAASVPAAPSLPAPHFPAPNFPAPDFQAPDFQAPDFQAPDFQAPDGQAPGGGAAEGAVVGGAVAEGGTIAAPAREWRRRLGTPRSRMLAEWLAEFDRRVDGISAERRDGAG